LTPHFFVNYQRCDSSTIRQEQQREAFLLKYPNYENSGIDQLLSRSIRQRTTDSSRCFLIRITFGHQLRHRIAVLSASYSLRGGCSYWHADLDTDHCVGIKSSWISE
jgi:hypothetical protein